jgi:hypothetical protein
MADGRQRSCRADRLALRLIGRQSAAASAGADVGGVGAAPYAAGGRPAVGGLALVGERGPELFVPDVAGRIVSNADLRQSLGGGGGRTIYMPITIQTPDPGSFRASAGQVAADLGAAARRAMR